MTTAIANIEKFLQQIDKELTNEHTPNWGIMSAQHMVEHLIWVTKATAGRKGEPPAEPTKSHLFFKKFIANGAVFQYRPKEDAVLPALKYDLLEEAIENVVPALDRFFTYFEDSNTLSYNPIMGELNGEELLLFHANHYWWHLDQFGLM